MVLPNIYSRRKRMAQQQGADVYQYETMSPKLRQQVLFIIAEWNSMFQDSFTGDGLVVELIRDTMKKELGVLQLYGSYIRNTDSDFYQWFLSCDKLDHVLDSIEMSVMLSMHYAKENRDGSLAKVSHGVDEINARFLEDGFGFQVVEKQVIEIGSTYIHREVTVPALSLLSHEVYAEANKEFRQAFDEFKTGNYDDCIHDCCNAFESVLKVILTNKGWPFSPADPAKKLLAAAFENNLIPSYMQNEFTGLRTVLESGVPTVRNKEAGHGTGVIPRNIPKYIASFQLHQTAAAIILLVEAAK